MRCRVTILVVMGLLLGLRTWADDGADVARERKKAWEAAAKEHEKLGSFCWSKRVYSLGKLEYARCLDLDPDNSKARRDLGWKKKDGEWVRDPRAKVPEEDAASYEVIQLVDSAYHKNRAQMCGKVADIMLRFAAWCTKRDLPRDAAEGYRMVLRYDGENQAARAALGFVQHEGEWLPPHVRDTFLRVAKELPAAPEGDVEADPTPVEQAIGVDLNVRKTDHFLVQGYMAPEGIPRYMRLAETTWREFHRVFDVDPDPGLLSKTIDVTLLDTREQHLAFVDNCSLGTAEGKALARQAGGDRGYEPPYTELYRGEHGSEITLRDGVVHEVSHILLMHRGGAVGGAWLFEGVSYYFSNLITRTALSQCIQFIDTGGGGRSWSDPKNWRPLIRRAVETGEDADLREVLKVSVNGLKTPMAIKGWSLFDFFMERHKDKFFKFLAVGASEGDQEAAIRSAFGWTIEELDRHWKDYVLETY